MGVKIHHIAYFLTLVLFLREVLDVVLGFVWNILLLIGAFITTMILLIGLVALSNHGMGTYKVFFVLYFLLLLTTFISLFVGLIILRTGRYTTNFVYGRGFVNDPYVRSTLEAEHDFWRLYIYTGFGFFFVELLYMWVMFRAYYHDKKRNEDRMEARRQHAAGSMPANFSFSMSANAPPMNPNYIPQQPPRYMEKEYYPLKTQSDV